MSKFKIGDRVRRVEGTWCEMRVGDIGTIDSFDFKYCFSLKEWKDSKYINNLKSTIIWILYFRFFFDL